MQFQRFFVKEYKREYFLKNRIGIVIIIIIEFKGVLEEIIQINIVVQGINILILVRVNFLGVYLIFFF